MDIYSEILSALATEEHVVLVTVISTSGSTPAGALSKMLVKQGGAVSLGTVGGGCMEGDVLLHANRLYQSGTAEILTFELNEDDLEHGLICGGTLEVLIEPVTNARRPLFERLKALRDNGTDAVVATVIDDNGTVGEKFAVVPGDPSSAEQLLSRIPHPIPDPADLIARAYRRQATQRVKLPGTELILEPAMGAPGLIIFGGGHVSKFVSRIASLAGFQISVIDDREKYANPIRFPEAARTLVLDFSEAFDRIEVKPSTYLLIVTRGHEYDEMLLEHALRTPASYIGMIGSKRKVLKAYERLGDRGIPADQLKRVHAPVGLEIGAVTAEEIAVSIVAQLVNIRRGGASLIQNKSLDVQTPVRRPEQRPVT
jgi:xanthine dehydrogenase accessory factor